MGRLQDFLLENELEQEMTMEVEISGFPFPFTIRSLTEGENKSIRRACQKPGMDKRTHQRQFETDTDLLANRLIIASCVDPNFKDAKLQEKYSVLGAEALVDVMLKPGQFVELFAAVQDINGFAVSINDLKDEAKNS